MQAAAGPIERCQRPGSDLNDRLKSANETSIGVPVVGPTGFDERLDVLPNQFGQENFVTVTDGKFKFHKTRLLFLFGLVKGSDQGL